jgi:hypothetical protein
MRCQVFGEPLVFYEKLLLVSDAQRKAVETVLQRLGCVSDWSPSQFAVTKFDSTEEPGVSMWTLSVPSVEDAKKIQSVLDAIE